MIDALIERFGEARVLFASGLLVGVVFGTAGQHSRFCMRAATIETSGFRIGPRMSIWLISFATAVAATQGLVALGAIDVSPARQLAAVGSLSGAIIGGLMFGVGMILARGCASRLLILSATGNLRALVTGLILTLVAQASLRGVLAPAREALTRLWLVEGGPERSLLALLHLGSATAAALAAAFLAAVLVWARRQGVEPGRGAGAMLVGLAVAGGWAATSLVAQSSFEVIAVSSVTFTGPATDTLMGLINETTLPLGFSVGLVPGVFIGSAVMAILSREFVIARFGPEVPMERYIAGAALMGFGAMLAGGCAVGAAVSGGAIMALTAWVAGASMWAGAILTIWTMGALAQGRSAFAV